MRILVLAAILALGLSIFPDTIEENDIRLSFIDFIRHYHRSYVTQGEKTERYEIFKKNYIQIFEHNLKNLPWTLKMNEFGDLSAEEFKMLYHNKKNYDQKKNQKNIFPPLKTENVEISDATGIDWTKIGLTVAPVVNQGSCGSCYAFSAVEAIQSLHYMDKGTMIIFSKQQVVDCSGKFQNEGCDGGYMQEVFEYVMEYGIERESDYKYRGYDEKCKYNKTKVAYTIDGYYNCTCNQDYDNEALIKDLTQRPISIGVDANTWQFYWGGIYIIYIYIYI